MIREMAVMSAVAAVLGAVAVATTAARADGVDDILKRGELIVAVQTQGPPNSFVNKKGERVGFMIDLVKAMAADMGVKLTTQDYDFRGLIPAAMSGKVDFIAADMAPTSQRSLQLLFSDAFFEEPVVMYAKKSKGFHNVTELNRRGVSVGVVQGSANRMILQRQFPKAEIREFSGGGPALAEAVAADRVDAAINTASNARGNIARYGDAFGVIEGEQLYVWPEAFGVRPEQTHLLAWINNWLYWAKRDGKLNDWIRYWRTSDDWRTEHM